MLRISAPAENVSVPGDEVLIPRRTGPIAHGPASCSVLSVPSFGDWLGGPTVFLRHVDSDRLCNCSMSASRDSDFRPNTSYDAIGRDGHLWST